MTSWATTVVAITKEWTNQWKRNLKEHEPGNKGQSQLCVSIFHCQSPRIFFLINLLIWLRWVSIVAHGLSLVTASGGYSSLQCAAFSLQWLLLLRSTGSRQAGFSSCGTRVPERRLSSCGARAQLLHGMWIQPDQGSNPSPPHWQADS